MQTEKVSDVVVLGAGPGGLALLGALKDSGLEVTVIEDELVGGECRYYGCVVSKAMLRPIEVHDAATTMRAVRYDQPRVDVQQTFARRDRIVDNWVDNKFVVRMIDSVGATLVRGHGEVIGDKCVRVRLNGSDADPKLIRARHAVVIAVGRKAAYPPIEGVEAVKPWTNRAGTGSHQVPGSLIVLGAGPAGCELAVTWAALGSKVTLVQMGDRILPTMEPEGSERVLARMRECGIDVALNTQATSVHRDDGGHVHVETRDGRVLSAEELLLAIGTAAATADIGAKSVGLNPGRLIPVRDSTEVKGVDGQWLYAIGNCTDQAGLTHMSQYQAQICANVITARIAGLDLGGRYSPHEATAETTAVTQVVFTDPQIGSAGHTEHSALDSGIKIRVVSAPIEGPVGGRLHEDDYSGLVKLIIDNENDLLVGATFIGRDVSNMVHAATVAIVGEVPIARLRHAIPPFPTLGQVWVDLLNKAG